MNCLIIEDDLIWTIRLNQMLRHFFPESIIETTASCEQAKEFLAQKTFDLVVADIILPDGLSFELVDQTSRTYPIIFLTGVPESEYMNEAMSLPLTTFLVKPFHELTLKAAIETMMRLAGKDYKSDYTPIGKTDFFIKNQHNQQERVKLSEIVFLKAEGNYTIIHKKDRKYTVKQSLRQFMKQLDSRFVQIQKAYVVNKEYIDRISRVEKQVILGHYVLPIGRSFQQDFFKVYNDSRDENSTT
jgi:two-component system, LytTR family, response regulator LytT